jgi:phosphatidylglycerol:prolipoprotein diacylglycerol transferase
VTLAVIGYPAIDPVALRIGPLTIRWYGLAYLVGFVGAALVARWLIRRWRLAISDDDLMTILLGAVIGVVVGGRLGYVLFYGGGDYLRDPGAVLALWDGGMSFHGGLVGIMVAGVVVSRILRIPLLTLWDIGAVGAPIGLGLGRLANFVNGELWGRVSNAPWAMVFPGAGPLARHPSQLYEAALEGAVLLTVMVLLARRLPPRPRGELVGWVLALYGVFRICVEFFREPDVQLGFIAGHWMTMGMVLSVPMVVAGVAIIAAARRAGLPQEGRRAG